jgi:hypothetical protein
MCEDSTWQHAGTHRYAFKIDPDDPLLTRHPHLHPSMTTERRCRVQQRLREQLQQQQRRQSTCPSATEAAADEARRNGVDDGRAMKRARYHYRSVRHHGVIHSQTRLAIKRRSTSRQFNEMPDYRLCVRYR